jgi:hypothetical protein
MFLNYVLLEESGGDNFVLNGQSSHFCIMIG